MDGRVIDVAWPLRRLLVGLILIKRPAESGHAYDKIWTKDGSPLVVTSKHVRTALQQRMSVPIELGMRYQNPSIESAVKNLAAKGVNETLLIPLFPHYAMSSYETAVVRVQEVAARLAPGMKITVQPPYYNSPDFITALVASAAELTAPILVSAVLNLPSLNEEQFNGWLNAWETGKKNTINMMIFGNMIIKRSGF